jgi:hypothetical protein
MCVDRVVVEPSTWKRRPRRRSWSPKDWLQPGLLLQQVKNHLTPARPHPLQDEALPGGHQDPQDRTEALGVTHWSRRLLADQLGSSHSTVVRVWAEHDGKPWQTEAFRFSPDPELEARVRDVVGLSLEPSAHAIVLGVDEKSQIQALERTQPSRPHPGRCPPATSARSSDSPGPVEGVADDRLAGERPACPHPGSYASKALLYRCAASPAASCRAAGCRERPRAPWSSKCPGQGPYGGRGRS